MTNPDPVLVEKVARVINPTAWGTHAKAYGIDDSTPEGREMFKRTFAYGARLVSLDKAREVLSVIENELGLASVEWRERALTAEVVAEAAVSEIERLKEALEKLRGYNAGAFRNEMNYRPWDHLEVIDKALGLASASASPALGKDQRQTEASRPVVPPGYVLVPREQTKEMLRAGVEAWKANGYASISWVWEAMIAAATEPTPHVVPPEWQPDKLVAAAKAMVSVAGPYLKDAPGLRGAWRDLRRAIPIQIVGSAAPGIEPPSEGGEK